MEEIIKKQREFFQSGKTLDFSFRIQMLKKLKFALEKYEPQIFEALKLDLGKSNFESYATELGMVYEEINFATKHLKSWMKPKRVKTPIINFYSTSKVYSEPLGVCLVMSPWNYPLQLTLVPVVGAIAAGNCVVIKPSRYSYHTSLIVEQMLNETFSTDYISIFQGGSDINQRLLNIRFDYIFFTGSPFVGKIVMEAASKYLTPVALELGGKSPCIVDETANIKVAARRIIWGKCLNSGQTCVAPDYLLVHSKVKDELLCEMKNCIRSFYGETPINHVDYGKIINLKHYNRLKGLLENQTVVHGGCFNDELMKIEPTILSDVSFDSQVMREEIFGPILPMISFESIYDVVDMIQKFEKPLALYLFTEDKKVEQFILRHVSFGGGCVNDTVMHLTNLHMGFGGVGQSGMGRYHGKLSFEAFSHQKSILKKALSPDVALRYPPYKNNLKKIKKLLK